MNIPPPPRMPDTWIDRVRAADAEAEEKFVTIETGERLYEAYIAHALISIAAELRAARIAQRPGAGKS